MQTIAIVLDISLENLLNQSHFQNRRRNRYFPCKNYFVVVIIKVIKVIIDVIEMMTPCLDQLPHRLFCFVRFHRPRHFGPNNKRELIKSALVISTIIGFHPINFSDD
jgi:hypothetical protein